MEPLEICGAQTEPSDGLAEAHTIAYNLHFCICRIFEANLRFGHMRLPPVLSTIIHVSPKAYV